MNTLTKKYRLVWNPAKGMITAGEFTIGTKTQTNHSVFEADDKATLTAKILELGYEIPEELLDTP